MKASGNKMPLSLMNIAVCGAGILAVFVLGIYPNNRELKNLDNEIKEINLRIKEQKVLFPIFKDLLTKSREQLPENLALPEEKKLPRGDTKEITAAFHESAQSQNLTVEDLTPDMDSLINSSGLLKMAARLLGSYSDLNAFLLKIGEIPYLEHIEEIKIIAVQDTDELELNLNLYFLQEQG